MALTLFTGAIRIMPSAAVVRHERQETDMKHGLRHRLGAVGAMAVALTMIANAQQPRPRELFERARLLEENVRTLNRAVAIYEEVVTHAKTDRTLAAAAELRIALARERQGKPGARAMFARVAREYADVPEVASTASARAAATAARGRGEALPRRVLEGGYAILTDISSDGRVAVGMQRSGYSSNSVVVRDMASGDERVIVAGSLTGSAAAPRLSPDGRQVVYAWVDSDQASNVTGGSLRMVPIDASARPAVLFQDAGKWARPAGWSPDGKRVLLSVQRAGAHAVANDSTALALLSLEDKSYRVLRTFESWQSHYPERLSPDGRYVAYATEARAGATDRYVYVLDTETGRESAVVTSAGSRQWPVWSGDGSQLLFVEGSALKAVTVRDGRAVGEPRVVQSGFTGSLLASTTSGALYFVQQTGGGNYEYILSRTPAPGERPTTFPGLSASWSADGRHVAFVRGQSARELQLIVRDVESGSERSYRRAGLTAVSPRWLPDSSGLIVVVDEEVNGRRGAVFGRIDLENGSFKQLLERDIAAHARTGVGALSPEGKTLYLGVRRSAEGPVTGIVAVDLSTGEERQVTSFTPAPGESSDVGIAVSPDGGRLAVSVWTKAHATARIFVVSTDGTGYQEVLPSFETGWLSDKLRWTPDGRWLVFAAADASKNWRILRVPAAGGPPEFDGIDYGRLSGMLTGMRMWPGNFNNIDISPDGSRIMVSALTFSQQELWTLDTIGGSEQPR